MSGGPSISLPYWLGSAKEALDSILALSRKSKETDFHDAQAKFVKFEREARTLHAERAAFRAGIVSLVLKFPDICREVGARQELIDKARDQ